jgi:hypothetical protein
VVDAFAAQTQQHGALLASGWPAMSMGLATLQQQQQPAHAARAASSRARWAEAQDENEAAPDTGGDGVEGSNQPDGGGGGSGADAQAGGQHASGSKPEGHSSSKVKKPPGAQQCPRCSSKNTKFCYYNNYNIKQPRYYCRVSASWRCGTMGSRV